MRFFWPKRHHARWNKDEVLWSKNKGILDRSTELVVFIILIIIKAGETFLWLNHHFLW